MQILFSIYNVNNNAIEAISDAPPECVMSMDRTNDKFYPAYSNNGDGLLMPSNPLDLI